MLLQVAHYTESGVMTSDEAAEVYEGLQKTLDHLQLQAASGCKFLPGTTAGGRKENLQLFYNRTGLGDNTILTTFDKKKMVYLNYDALNYIITTDEAFCNQVEEQLQVIMRRSTLISTVSEKQRSIFFNSLYEKIPTTLANK
jgi:hypothetical protein